MEPVVNLMYPYIWNLLIGGYMMTKERKASLFGLKNSNRDFSSKDNWGKNQFNSSFPAALACYMGKKK